MNDLPEIFFTKDEIETAIGFHIFPKGLQALFTFSHPQGSRIVADNRPSHHEYVAVTTKGNLHTLAMFAEFDTSKPPAKIMEARFICQGSRVAVSFNCPGLGLKSLTSEDAEFKQKAIRALRELNYICNEVIKRGFDVHYDKIRRECREWIGLEPEPLTYPFLPSEIIENIGTEEPTLLPAPS